MACGGSSTDDAEYFDFEGYDDDGSFDRMVQGIRERTSDEEERTRLLTSTILEDFVRSNIMTRGKRRESLRDKKDYQSINPHGFSTPNKKRSGDVSMAKRNGTGDRQEAETKSFSSNSTRRDKRSVKLGRVNEDDEKEEKRKSSKKQKKTAKLNFEKLGLDKLDFSDEIKAKIGKEGDKDFKFRIMKQIFQTDMRRHNDRFSMPSNQIKDREDFEAMNIRKAGEEVILVLDLGVAVHQRTMKLRRWEINNSFSYMLTSSWIDVLDRNAGILNANDVVQVYSFKRDKQLHLVLKKVMDADRVKEMMDADQDGSTYCK